MIGNKVVLRARGLTKAFDGQRILGGVDLTLKEGEIVLLRGENGSGKTTLLNILTGNVEPDAGTIEYLAGDSPWACQFPRHCFASLNPLGQFTPEFVARGGFGRTWQDVRLFGSHTLRENITVADSRNPGENPFLALIAPGIGARHEKARQNSADATLARLGLGGRETSSADMISLGQSKRVAIARAVAAGARVLFLDEPLAGLDLEGIYEVTALLQNLVRERSLTLVIVEHLFNSAHLQNLITVHWTLSEGVLTRKEASPTSEPAAEPGGVASGLPPDWFRLLAPYADEMPSESLPRQGVLTRFRLRGRFEARSALIIDRLVVKRGLRAIIGCDSDDAGLSITLNQGEFALLQAPNGWGKTTFLEALAGLIPTESGSIRVGEIDISKMAPWLRVRHGLRLDAAAERFFSSLTILDVGKLSGVLPQASTDLPPTRRLDCLSGGERRRAALGNFLKRPKGLVGLLDEPMLALDETASQSFARNLAMSDFLAVLITEPLRLPPSIRQGVANPKL